MERARVGGKEMVFLDGQEGDVLGYAIWYTFSKFTRHRDIVKGRFMKHGLPEFIPDPPNHRDAFKRICSEYKEKYLRKEGDTEVFLLVRPVDKGGNIRKLVIERRAGGKKLSYDIVGEVAYTRDEKTGAEKVEHELDTADKDVGRTVEEIVRGGRRKRTATRRSTYAEPCWTS